MQFKFSYNINTKIDLEKIAKLFLKLFRSKIDYTRNKGSYLACC